MTRNRRRLWIAAGVLTVSLLPGVALSAPPSVGQQYRWKAVFRAGLQGDRAQPGVAGLSGEWRETVVAVRTNEYDVKFQMASPRLEGAKLGQTGPKGLALAEERLSKPFWITIGFDGAFRSVHFTKDMEPSERNLLQTIATETQFVTGDPSRSVWTSVERDGGGGYLAIYQRSDAAHIRKKKLKYVEADTNNPASTIVSLDIEESEVNFTLAADGAIAVMDSVQRISLSVPGQAGNALMTRFEVHLSNLQSSVQTASVAGIPRGVEDLPITTHRLDPKVAQANVDNQLLAGQSNAAILAAAENKTPGIEAKLAAMFRRRPASIALAASRLAGGAGMHAIASAMAEVATDACIDALGSVAQNPAASNEARINALLAMQGLQDPSLQAMRIAVSLLDDPEIKLAAVARLTSGALARAGRKNHSEEADAIEVGLVARLQRATTVEDRKAYMSALGNSAGPRAFSVLTAALKDAREDIRAMAARDLRLVPGPENDILLASVLTRESSAVVRADALFAMRFRQPFTVTLRDAIVNAARTDSAESIRSHAVSLLRNDAGQPAEVADVLEWIGQNDSSPAVRRTAIETLAAIRDTATAK